MGKRAVRVSNSVPPMRRLFWLRRLRPVAISDALAAMAPPSLKPGRFRARDKLLAMLKSISRSAIMSSDRFSNTAVGK